MNLHERGARIAAPIIARDKKLNEVHHQFMHEGKKTEATHMVNVLTIAEILANDPNSLETIIFELSKND
jgi:hypothetical protein